MSKIVIKGAPARNWFAERLVQEYGPEIALAKTCGPMHQAVQAIIEQGAAKESQHE